jgi:hypothetical protein
VHVAETKETTPRPNRAKRPPVEEVPPPATAAGGDALVCNVAFCPICLAVTASRGAAPEALEHLLNAAREFFLAARAVIDVRADDLDGQARPGPTRLEKIDIG